MQDVTSVVVLSKREIFFYLYLSIDVFYHVWKSKKELPLAIKKKKGKVSSHHSQYQHDKNIWVKEKVLTSNHSLSKQKQVDRIVVILYEFFFKERKLIIISVYLTCLIINLSALSTFFYFKIQSFHVISSLNYAHI